ncbi:NfeD family protein [Halomonas halocynthiae]|uniref:NfeD family protein n=1 Tax=Halomonas halocynthiae TaxID=176290 RepID=UPI000401E7E3|nr:NfeD family protein [Halomonas halocynthiae]
MEWNPVYTWLVIALLLGLSELLSGSLLLLALAASAALTAILTVLGVSLPWQLLGMGVFSGVLVPLAIRVIRPRFSPHGVNYGTTGSGVERGRRYVVKHRDFDAASVLLINGDLYRLRVSQSRQTELPEGTEVIFERFEGTTAIVHLTLSTSADATSHASPDTPPTPLSNKEH